MATTTTTTAPTPVSFLTQWSPTILSIVAMVLSLFDPAIHSFVSSNPVGSFIGALVLAVASHMAPSPVGAASTKSTS